MTARLPTLRRTAYLLCGDEHRADDLVQVTITKLYVHWRRASAADKPDSYDAAALERLLRRDFTLELPPSSTWFSGDDAIAGAGAGLGSPGEWLMLPTVANNQPATGAYRRSEDGSYHAYAIVVLTATSVGIARIVVFTDHTLFSAFGFRRFGELGAFLLGCRSRLRRSPRGGCVG